MSLQRSLTLTTLTLTVAVSLGLAASTAHAEPGPRADLEIVLEASSLSINGATSGGAVVVAAVSREPHGHSSSVSRRGDLLTDSDGDGRVELAIEGEIPQRSVWVAVDLASGRAAFASPEGFLLRLEEVPPRWLIGAGEGHAEGLTMPRGFAEMLVVRPAAGAWSVTVFDGSAEDEDGPANNRLYTSLRNLKSLHGGPPAPDRLGPHDVVIIVDPNTLEIFAIRHGGPQA